MINKNFFADIPAELPEELIELIISQQSLRIERIVSRGHTSPSDFWYDQDMHEWVMVLQGRARLTFAERTEPLELGRGNHVNIPAHVKHRVEWTDPQQDTIWLAVFYR